jgi:hypothetical protein
MNVSLVVILPAAASYSNKGLRLAKGPRTKAGSNLHAAGGGDPKVERWLAVIDSDVRAGIHAKKSMIVLLVPLWVMVGSLCCEGGGRRLELFKCRWLGFVR